MSTENFTQITLQQLVNLDSTPVTASKYPKYTVNLGFSISNITATELAGAISSAQASAASAKTSETNAKTSETNAKASESAAFGSKNAAAASEAAALASKTAAAASETKAKTSETNAKASETAAKTSETNSKASETAAKTSETNAKSSETKSLASQNAAKTSETNAKTSETNAKASETAAFGSKNAAAASETAALASKTAAAASETKAKTSETNAKTSETNAKTSETNSKASENTAVASKDAAAISEANAKASETNSRSSEVNAKESETNAKTYELGAKDSADFALVQADRAEEIKNSMPSKEQFMATVKLYDTHQEAVDDLEWRDEGEKVLIWQETASAYGWYDVEVTDGVKSLVLDRNEKKIKTINNVAPDDLGNVQITLPGGNPSLWLGETVWFPYAPNETIGYSGVLPQDGRILNRVDYPDAWLAIEQGLVPSVSEAEWQAGAKSVFSRGDGSTTFRLPKWDGEVLRAPNSDDEIGEFHEQIPYITKVNDITPDDVTGAIILPYATKGANKDITSLDGISPTLTIRKMLPNEGTEGDGITIESKDPVGSSFGIANVGGGAAVFHNFVKQANGSATPDGFLIGGYGSRPWTGSTYTAHSNTAIHFLMDGQASETNHGGWTRILTCPKNGTQDSRRQTFAASNNGDLWIGTDVPMGTNAMAHATFGGDNNQGWDGRGLKQVVGPYNDINFLTPANGSDAPSITIRGTPFAGYAGGAKGATPANSAVWIGIDGHDGSKFVAIAAAMRFVPSSNQPWTTTNRGAGIIFSTTALNSTTRADRWSISGDGMFLPLADGNQSVGLPSNRLSAIYAVNGAIQTSDARLKSEVREFTADEIKAATMLSKEIGFFSWIEKQKEEGDEAREHVGFTVQRAIEIMESCNLDPMHYGFICHDVWEESRVVDHYENDTENPVYKTLPAGDRYSFRYDQLNLFIAKGFEARLAALEAK
ncbi:tail fiber protein [Pantoea phage vB_PagS_AAS21]|uniref:Tail fiber protein n=1 Tax=Pantoea phage vB_PagS_AAS21 TaxID=2575261 RepID=A0A4Y5P1C4_9CAUD|nr:tail fiber protein [Pantoea phage vB_PagS_AAS21]